MFNYHCYSVICSIRSEDQEENKVPQEVWLAWKVYGDVITNTNEWIHILPGSFKINIKYKSCLKHENPEVVDTLWILILCCRYFLLSNSLILWFCVERRTCIYIKKLGSFTEAPIVTMQKLRSKHFLFLSSNKAKIRSILRIPIHHQDYHKKITNV